MSKFTIDNHQLAFLHTVLQHYQQADDGVFLMMKGFSAKPGEVDNRSWARRGIQVLEDIEQKGSAL